MKSSRLISMSNKEKALRIDSETDLSSVSDNDSNTSSINVITSTNEISELSKINYCLICSILSSLSNVNCCSKHLALLTKASPAQIVSMMSPRDSNRSKLECHCRLQSKRCHRCRSSSLLSSSLKSHPRKEGSITLTSFNTNDSLLSPNRERSSSPYIESQKRPTVHRQSQSNRLSSSLINSPMNNNNSQKRNRTLSSPIVTRGKQGNIDRTESVIQNESIQQRNNQSTSPDLVELNVDKSYFPRILLKRVIHVKDDDEELILDNPQIILNMAQATKQMVVQKKIQPKILLKRVCLEQ